MRKFCNKNAFNDGVLDASKGFENRNQYNEGSTSWHEYERGYKARSKYPPDTKV